MKHIIPLFILSIFFGCSNNDKGGSGIETIDLYNAFENKKEVYLSQFVEEPEYIPLELAPNSVLAGIRPPIILAEDYIVVKAKQILLFDRNTGKFIKGVGEEGRGPDEYASIAGRNFYNEESNVFYARNYGGSHLYIYDLEGKKTGSIKFPTLSDPTNSAGLFRTYYEGYLDSATFACWVPNLSQTENKKLVLYTNDSIIRVFPNYLKWGDGIEEVTRAQSFSNTRLMRWDNNLYFKELFNDTLFRVTIDELIPRLVFDGGKYSFPYKLQGTLMDSPDISRNYFLIWNVNENSSYLFFQLNFDKTYTGYYDKRSKATYICEYSGETKKAALIDDINDFLPVTPTNFTKNNEMVAFFNAKDIKKWIDSNPEKAEAFGRKFPWLYTIDEMSNPVIFIGKCKD